MQPGLASPRPGSGTGERPSVQQRIAMWTDIPLTALAFAMVALFVIELAAPLGPVWSARVAQAQTVIWAIFVIDFVLEFSLAPSKTHYLQQNWLSALAVLLPAVRSLRIFRSARVFRSFTVLRLGTVLNRGVSAIGYVSQRGGFGYVLLIAIAVTVTAAAGVYVLERGQPNATIVLSLDF